MYLSTPLQANKHIRVFLCANLVVPAERVVRADRNGGACGIKLKGPGHVHVACGVLLPARSTEWLILKVHSGSSSARMVPV